MKKEKVPTFLLMAAKKGGKKYQHCCSWQQKKGKKRKSHHFCSWEQKKEKRESPTIFAHDSKQMKKEKVLPFLLMTAKKRKKRKSQLVCSWEKKKRKSQHFWLWQQQIWKPLNESFGSLQWIWEKKLQTIFTRPLPQKGSSLR